MIVVDASVWVDYFNGRPTPEADALDRLLQRELLVVGDITITEVLQGFRDEKSFRQARNLMEIMEMREMWGRAIAIEGARNFRRLRKMGVTVPKTIDVVIATFCLENGHTLLHADRDFDPIEKHLGLRVFKS